MPVGAIVGSAVIGAGATMIGSSKAASAQKKAAATAADTSLQVADKNNAFAQSIYDQNAARLDPTAARGNTAGDAIMGLLLGQAPSSGAASGSGTGSTPGGTQTAPVASQTPVTPTTGTPPALTRALNPLDVYSDSAPVYGTVGLSPAERAARMGGEPMALPTIGPQAVRSGSAIASSGGTPSALQTIANPGAGLGAGATSGSNAGTPATGGTSGAATGAPSALSAWDQFRNSTNYQFRLDQGLDATATKYAAAGAFESGAEKKAINDYAQNFASNELANYMDRLYQQEALGVTAASSLAGVGTNLVSQVSANNRAAGDAAANAALAAGQASANNWTNIGGAISGAAGTIGGALGSSYHPSTANPSNIVFTGGAGYTGSGYAI